MTFEGERKEEGKVKDKMGQARATNQTLKPQFTAGGSGDTRTRTLVLRCDYKLMSRRRRRPWKKKPSP
jgi:hypothetical protein